MARRARMLAVPADQTTADERWQEIERRFNAAGDRFDASIARTRAWIADVESREPDNWPAQWAEAEARLCKGVL